MEAPRQPLRSPKEGSHIRKMMDLNEWLGQTGSVDLVEPSLAPSDKSFWSDDGDASSFVGSAVPGGATAEGHFRREVISILTLDALEQEQESFSNQHDHRLVENDTDNRDVSTVDDSPAALSDKRAEEVRSVFADPTMWRYLDHFQIECLGTSDCFDNKLPSMRVRRDDPWQWFESEIVKENNVVMKVEVSAMKYLWTFKCFEANLKNPL